MERAAGRREMSKTGVLIFFCGKMGAGKTTLSKQIAGERNAVLMSEDEWLAALYPGQISSFDDYLACSKRLRPLVKSLVRDILLTGTDVVMDFPANTRPQRKWFLDLVSDIGAGHQLIYLNISDAQCLKQIGKRRKEQPERSAFDTEAMFRRVTRFFEDPGSDEGVHIRQINA